MSLAFSGGGTGAPEITAIDFAAALGAASQGGAGQRLAVDVLCLRWWPGRIDGPMRVVGHKEVQRPGPSRNGEPTTYIERMPIERPGETPAYLSIAGLVARRLARRAMKLDGKTGARVMQGPFLERWSRAVIDEYRNPHVCPECAGTGRPGECPVPVYESTIAGAERITRFEWTLCKECEGTAVIDWGKKRRAKALGINETVFRNELNEIHQGALALLRELEHRGAVLFVRRIGD